MIIIMKGGPERKVGQPTLSAPQERECGVFYSFPYFLGLPSLLIARRQAVL
jgi:hypothetical protein